MRATVVVVSLSLAAVACGQGSLAPGVGEAPRAVGSASDVRPEEVAVGIALATARGHDLVAAELLKLGDRVSASDQVELGLDALDAAGPEADAVSGVQLSAQEEITSGGTPAQVGAALAQASRATLAVEEDTVGDAAGLAAYRASVVAGLATESAVRYANSIVGDGTFDTARYLSAYALLRAAAELHEGLASVWAGQGSDRVKQEAAMLAHMFEAMPTAELPREVVDPNEVAAAAHLLGVSLGERLHAQASPNPPTTSLLAWIPPLLEAAFDEYRRREPGVAIQIVRDVEASFYGEARGVLVETVPDIAAQLDELIDRLGGLLSSEATEGEIGSVVEEIAVVVRFAAGQIPRDATGGDGSS